MLVKVHEETTTFPSTAFPFHPSNPICFCHDVGSLDGGAMCFILRTTGGPLSFAVCSSLQPLCRSLRFVGNNIGLVVGSGSGRRS